MSAWERVTRALIVLKGCAILWNENMGLADGVMYCGFWNPSARPAGYDAGNAPREGQFATHQTHELRSTRPESGFLFFLLLLIWGDRIRMQ